MAASFHAAVGFVGAQLGGTFLRPASTFFLPGLLVTLVIATRLAVPRATRLPRLRVVRRALLPARLWRSRSGRVDIGFFLFSLLGGGALFGGMLVSAQAVRTALAPSLAGLPPLAAGWPVAALSTFAAIAGFVAYDFTYWLDHRLKHSVPALWAFHKVHHSAESLSLLTNFRVHPVDTMLFYNLVALIVGGAAALLDALAGTRVEPSAIGAGVIAMIAATALTHLQHSQLWVTLGPRWGRLLLGPAHHQIHHSADPRHFDRNFGNVLTLWDRLSGSFHMPAATREVTRFGLDEIAPHSFAALTVRPFAEAIPPVDLRRRRSRLSPGHDPV